jgi:hypothetical protein
MFNSCREMPRPDLAISEAHLDSGGVLAMIGMEMLTIYKIQLTERSTLWPIANRIGQIWAVIGLHFSTLNPCFIPFQWAQMGLMVMASNWAKLLLESAGFQEVRESITFHSWIEMCL